MFGGMIKKYTTELVPAIRLVTETLKSSNVKKFLFLHVGVKPSQIATVLEYITNFPKYLEADFDIISLASKGVDLLFGYISKVTEEATGIYEYAVKSEYAIYANLLKHSAVQKTVIDQAIAGDLSKEAEANEIVEQYRSALALFKNLSKLKGKVIEE